MTIPLRYILLGLVIFLEGCAVNAEKEKRRRDLVMIEPTNRRLSKPLLTPIRSPGIEFTV
jgi:hypothetical protein